MALKITLFFNQSNRGWTETWYDTLNSDVSVVLDSAGYKNVYTQAIGCRTAPTVLYAARASTVTGPKLSQTKTFGQTYEASLPPGVPGFDGPDVVSTDAYINIPCVGNYRRALCLRGLRDSWVLRDNNGQDGSVGAFDAAWKRYLASVYNMVWGMKRVKRIGEVGVSTVQVTSISPHLTNIHWSTLHFNIASTWPGGQNVPLVFRGIPTDDAPGLPRFITTVGIINTPPVFTADIPYRLRSQTIVSPVNMTASNVAIEYPALLNSYSFVRFSERKTGRPFGALRGRASAGVRVQ